jgi:hypothetical protein
MQYISPFSIISIDKTEDLSDRRQLQLAKKKLLAELDLAGGQSIIWNGKELTKNAIVNFFENLSQTNDFEYHFAIKNDPVLCRFLEHNEIEGGTWMKDAAIYKDATFISWVSAYYLNAFRDFAPACFLHLKDIEWSTLLNNPVLMTSFHKEEAWNKVEKLIEKDKFQLEFYLENKTAQHNLDQLETLTSENYVNILMSLDKQRFALIRDEYAFTVMQVCIDVFNNKNRGWASKKLEIQRGVAVSENMVNQVDEKIAEMYKVADGDPNGQSSDSSPGIGTIIRVILFIMFVIYRINACNNNNDKPNYKYNPVPVYITDSAGNRIEVNSKNFQMVLENLRKKSSSPDSLTTSSAFDTIVVKPKKRVKLK